MIWIQRFNKEWISNLSPNSESFVTEHRLPPSFPSVGIVVRLLSCRLVSIGSCSCCSRGALIIVLVLVVSLIIVVVVVLLRVVILLILVIILLLLLLVIPLIVVIIILLVLVVILILVLVIVLIIILSLILLRVVILLILVVIVVLLVIICICIVILLLIIWGCWIFRDWVPVLIHFSVHELLVETSVILSWCALTLISWLQLLLGTLRFDVAIVFFEFLRVLLNRLGLLPHGLPPLFIFEAHDCRLDVLLPLLPVSVQELGYELTLLILVLQVKICWVGVLRDWIPLRWDAPGFFARLELWGCQYSNWQADKLPLAKLKHTLMLQIHFDWVLYLENLAKPRGTQVNSGTLDSFATIIVIWVICVELLRPKSFV